MAVNLTKPFQGREYTPVHLMDEEESIQRSTLTAAPDKLPSYTPEHIAYEPPAPDPETDIKISVIHANNAPAVVENQKPLSYSQIAQNKQYGFHRHLESVFRVPTDDKIDKLRSLGTEIHKMLRLNLVSTILAVTGSILGGFGIITAICTGALRAVLPTIVLTSIAIVGFAMAGVGLAIAHFAGVEDWCYLLHKTLRKATNVYICNTGADTDATNKKLEWRQYIDRFILKPKRCSDYDIFRTVTHNEHDVYVVYSDDTNSIVFIDPKLFE